LKPPVLDRQRLEAPAAFTEKWKAPTPVRRLSMSIQTPSEGSWPSRRWSRRTIGAWSCSASTPM